MKHFICQLILLLCPLHIAHALDWGNLSPNETAYYIQDLQTGQVLAEHRADVSMNPASTMKLITAYAAFGTLGSQYRWINEFKSPATIANGALNGDLYWLGSGDPSFDQKHLIAMQQQLQQQGISDIRGRVVLDRSQLPAVQQPEGFDHDTEATFTTAPDAHMIAYKVLWLTLTDPDTDPGQAPIRSNPPLIGMTIDYSGIVWQNGRCRGLKNHLHVRHDSTQDRLILTGNVPRACIGQTMFVNLFDAPRFAQESFRGHWLGQGLQGLYGFTQGQTPSGSRSLARHISPPLSQVLRDMNKHSNNLIARSVFLALGGNSAEAAVRRQLALARINDEALILENGSGLSRRERATARLLGQMLHSAYHSTWRNDFIDTLPIAATDGTLKTRFPQFRGALRLKTGTLRDVRALAGYHLPANGRPLVVVIIINSPRSSSQLAALDRLTTQLIEQAQTPTLPPPINTQAIPSSI